MNKLFTCIIALIFAALPALAVTEKEMEEAKAITAKAYLRYANDGSGYLDDVKASSMAELQNKLKTKEKENLKAFNSVKVPADYASWDKAKLVEFWSITFFSSPNLAEKGKAARSVVKRRLQAMNVAAPAKTEQPAAQAEPMPAKESEKATPAAETSGPTEAQTPEEPSAEQAIEKQEEILADQNAIAKDLEDKESDSNREENHTWIYVIVLIILVGVVIWLVVFAANMMKKQNPDSEKRQAASASASQGDNSLLQAQFSKAMAKKNDELKSVGERLAAAEQENALLTEKIEALKDENRRLSAALSHAKTTESRETHKEQSVAAVAPKVRKVEEQPAKILNVIYLGRANARGLFVRADRRLTPGHTIYRLDTRDGLVGTFHVVDTPEVTDIALENPAEYLAGGCTSPDLLDTAEATRIITVNAGTAIFENGCWKVLRKSKIRYE